MNRYFMNISLSEESKENMTFKEFKETFGKHFVGKKETVEEGYKRLTGRDGSKEFKEHDFKVKKGKSFRYGSKSSED